MSWYTSKRILSAMIFLNMSYSFSEAGMRMIKKRKNKHTYQPRERDVTTPPTMSPSLYPSSIPSNILSLTPSAAPVTAPSLSPSSFYSQDPSTVPSISSIKKTNYPSTNPSAIPSNQPTTALPSAAPSYFPSQEPSVIATSKDPSAQPSQSLPGFPSLLVTSKPTSIPTIMVDNPAFTSCNTSPDKRLIGDQTLNEVIVSYKYQMEFLSSFTLTSIVEYLESEINRALVNEQGFIQCTENIGGYYYNASALKMKSFVAGISSNPVDSISGESCPFKQVASSIGIICDVFDGYLTLFLDENHVRRLDQKEEDLVLSTSRIIKQNMDNGIFNSAHVAIVRLKAIESDKDDIVEEDDESLIKDSERPRINQGAIVPSYAWMFFVAFGGILLTGIAGIFRLRCQRISAGSRMAASNPLSSNDSFSSNNSLLTDEEDINTIKASNIVQSTEDEESFGDDSASFTEGNLKRMALGNDIDLHSDRRESRSMSLLDSRSSTLSDREK